MDPLRRQQHARQIRNHNNEQKPTPDTPSIPEHSLLAPTPRPSPNPSTHPHPTTPHQNPTHQAPHSPKTHQGAGTMGRSPPDVGLLQVVGPGKVGDDGRLPPAARRGRKVPRRPAKLWNSTVDLPCDRRRLGLARRAYYSGAAFRRMGMKPWAIILTTINRGLDQALRAPRQFECNYYIDTAPRQLAGDKSFTASITGSGYFLVCLLPKFRRRNCLSRTPAPGSICDGTMFAQLTLHSRRFGW